ncbi:MAG: hypothetical protein NTW86_27695 [Candidatus Sumerlaeota bacterium]|nr:hypothetical protein [Candidatus Sumerlaeota bacterium]
MMQAGSKSVRHSALAAAALLIALGLWVFVRNQPIDVGLDLAAPVASEPVLRWADGHALMEPVEGAFVPRKSFFKVAALGRHDRRSEGAQIQVVDNFSQRGRLSIAPPGSWTARNGCYVFSGAEPGALVWEGHDPPTTVTLQCARDGGLATLTTLEGETALNLYSGKRKLLEKPLPTAPVARFQARIPRRALASLRIDFSRPAPPAVERLYVAGWVPVIFFGRDVYPRSAWGRITENWTPRAEGRTIYVPRIGAVECGGAATFFALAVAAYLALGLGALAARRAPDLLKRALQAPDLKTPLEPFRPRRFAAFFAAFALMGLVWLSGFYPGTMNSDSLTQWKMAHRLGIHDAHPALLTLCYRWITRVWDSPAAIALAQILLQSVALAWAMDFLCRARLRRAAVLALFLLAWLSPRNGAMGVVLWKDVPYSAVVLLLTVLLARFPFEASARRRWGLAALLGFLAALAPLLRHNGLLILLGMAILAPVFFWPWRRFLWASGLAALLTYGTVVWALFPLYHVQHFPYWPVFTWMELLAPVVDQDPPLSAQECGFLDSARTLNDRWAYNSASAAMSLNGFHAEFIVPRVGELRRLVCSLGGRYPSLVARGRVQQWNFLCVPFQTAALPVSYPMFRITRNTYHLETRPLSPALNAFLRGLVAFTSQKALYWLVWLPGLRFWVVLTAMIAIAWRTKEFRRLAPFAPALLNTLSLALLCFSQELRYQFPLTLSTGFLVGLALLPRAPSDLPEAPADPPADP